MEHASETFTEAERARLAPHFTDLDGPVFALVNLPETVKGALFARYSRYPGTLRRLFLDEFAHSLPEQGRAWEPGEGERAARLYETIFLGYGDDSVAQLGGAHVACEWVSNVLTKLLQRPRLGAYLEQSTRYIAYDAPMPGGGYRYYRDPSLGPEYEVAMDALFDTYAAALPVVMAWAAEQFPRRDGEPEGAHARAVKAKALDLLRGLLPAASLSHMGIFASGQTYEQLILHLLAHPLPEAQRYGRLILEAVQAVIPSFVARVERPDRGGAWVEYLRARAEAGRAWAARMGLDSGGTSAGGGPAGDAAPDEAGARGVGRGDAGAGKAGAGGIAAGDAVAGDVGRGGGEGPSVRLLHVDGTEDDLLAALLFEAADVSEERTRATVGALSAEQRAAALRDLVGARENRRHRPGRGFEALRYRFEIVSDYGAFRDLQRHRMLTCQWQALTPHLGAEVPEEVERAGVGDAYRRALEVSRGEYERLAARGLHEAAPYAVCLGYRIRYVLDMNARAAMQLIELRSGREGHPSYRAVAHELHARIAAVHPAVAAAMTHVDRETEPRLERILSEMRTQAKRDGQ